MKIDLGNKIQGYFSGKKVLITGATGTIGKAILNKILNTDVDVVRVFSRDEYKQFNMMQEYTDPRLRFFLGDVRDKERLKFALLGVNVVIHCAALKHVPLCEYNPFEAVKTNVFGTQNLIEVAIEEGVERFITISTDKAVSPTSTMGATKLLAERMTVSANNFKGGSPTRFMAVRFGNVLGSRGSVLDLWVKQARSGYITLTHEEMVRYFMRIEDAAELVLKALVVGEGGEIFILPMKKVFMKDFARAFCDVWNELTGRSLDIKKIGVRPGEKMEEELVTEVELRSAFLKNGMIAIDFKNDVTISEEDRSVLKDKLNEFMSYQEIKDLINGYLKGLFN